MKEKKKKKEAVGECQWMTPTASETAVGKAGEVGLVPAKKV